MKKFLSSEKISDRTPRVPGRLSRAAKLPMSISTSSKTTKPLRACSSSPTAVAKCPSSSKPAKSPSDSAAR